MLPYDEYSQPATAVTTEDGRTYVHPVTKERFTSVTTILSIIDKPYIPQWYGKLAACEVLDNISLIPGMSRIPICDDGKCRRCIPCWIKHLSRAGERERNAAGNRGSRVHHVAEHLALDGVILPHREDIAPYVQQFLRFVERYRPTFDASEVTVLNRTHGWAGTLDAVVRVEWMPKRLHHLISVPCLADYKTSKHVDFVASLQVAAYRHAEAVLLPDGTELEMPDMDPGTALSVQIRPHDYWVRPVDITDGVYFRFLRVLDVYRDMKDTKGLMGYAIRKDAK